MLSYNLQEILEFIGLTSKIEIKRDRTAFINTHTTLASLFPEGKAKYYKQQIYDLTITIKESTMLGYLWVSATCPPIFFDDTGEVKWLPEKLTHLNNLEFQIYENAKCLNSEIETLLRLNYDLYVLNYITQASIVQSIAEKTPTRNFLIGIDIIYRSYSKFNEVIFQKISEGLYVDCFDLNIQDPININFKYGGQIKFICFLEHVVERTTVSDAIAKARFGIDNYRQQRGMLTPKKLLNFKLKFPGIL